MNNVYKITMPQVLRYYRMDGSYYDIPLGEIIIANNPYEVQQTNKAIGLLGLGALALYLLSR